MLKRTSHLELVLPVLLLLDPAVHQLLLQLLFDALVVTGLHRLVGAPPTTPHVAVIVTTCQKTFQLGNILSWRLN